LNSTIIFANSILIPSLQTLSVPPIITYIKKDKLKKFISRMGVYKSMRILFISWLANGTRYGKTLHWDCLPNGVRNFLKIFFSRWRHCSRDHVIKHVFVHISASL